MFKELVRPVWERSGRGVAVVLDVQKEVALEQFSKRERVEDVLERRFQEYEELGSGVMEAMRRDGVMVCVEKGEDLEKVVEGLAQFLG